MKWEVFSSCKTFFFLPSYKSGVATASNNASLFLYRSRFWTLLVAWDGVKWPLGSLDWPFWKKRLVRSICRFSGKDVIFQGLKNRGHLERNYTFLCAKNLD